VYSKQLLESFDKIDARVKELKLAISRVEELNKLKSDSEMKDYNNTLKEYISDAEQHKSKEAAMTNESEIERLRPLVGKRVEVSFADKHGLFDYYLVGFSQDNVHVILERVNNGKGLIASGNVMPVIMCKIDNVIGEYKEPEKVFKKIHVKGYSYILRDKNGLLWGVIDIEKNGEQLTKKEIGDNLGSSKVIAIEEIQTEIEVAE
jgi:hypothetical protein